MNKHLPSKSNINLVLQSIYFESEIDDEYNGYNLIITISSENISIRELGSFLFIIDRFYGRLVDPNFKSYALTERSHLKISSITSGSAVITINDILQYIDREKTIWLLLLIQFCGSALKAGSEALVKVAKSYNEYEQGRLTRYIRKSLREDLAQDEVLKNLDEKSRNKLAELLEKRYSAEKKYLTSASKFARKKLKSVELKKKKLN